MAGTLWQDNRTETSARQENGAGQDFQLFVTDPDGIQTEHVKANQILLLRNYSLTSILSQF